MAIPTSQNYDLALGNGLFVRAFLLDEASNKIWTWQESNGVASTLGLSARRLGMTSGPGDEIAFAKGRFLALGGDKIWSSPCGANWVEHTVGASKVVLSDATFGAGVSAREGMW